MGSEPEPWFADCHRPTDKAKAHDVIEKKAHKRFILLRSRFGEISNTSGMLPFPEEKKELILKIEQKKWA